MIEITEQTPDYKKVLISDYKEAVVVAKLMFGATRKRGSGYTMTVYETKDNGEIVIERVDFENKTYWHVYFPDHFWMK